MDEGDHVTPAELLYRRVLLEPSYKMVDLIDGELRLKKGALQIDLDGMSVYIRTLLSSLGYDQTVLLDRTRHSGVFCFEASVPMSVHWHVIVSYDKKDAKLGEAHGLVQPPLGVALHIAKADLRDAISDACTWAA